MRADLRRDIPLRELPVAINDPVFAAACANELLRLLGK